MGNPRGVLRVVPETHVLRDTACGSDLHACPCDGDETAGAGEAASASWSLPSAPQGFCVPTSLKAHALSFLINNSSSPSSFLGWLEINVREIDCQG